MARLFTAVELSAATRAAIVTCQSDLAQSLQDSGVSGLRLVRPEQLHVTLVFIGEVHASRVPTIVDAMAPPIPFTASISRSPDLACSHTMARRGCSGWACLAVRVNWASCLRWRGPARGCWYCAPGSHLHAAPDDRPMARPGRTRRAAATSRNRRRGRRLDFRRDAVREPATIRGADHIPLVRAPLAAPSASLHDGRSLPVRIPALHCEQDAGCRRILRLPDRVDPLCAAARKEVGRSRSASHRQRKHRCRQRVARVRGKSWRVRCHPRRRQGSSRRSGGGSIVRMPRTRRRLPASPRWSVTSTRCGFVSAGARGWQPRAVCSAC